MHTDILKGDFCRVMKWQTVENSNGCLHTAETWDSTDALSKDLEASEKEEQILQTEPESIGLEAHWKAISVKGCWNTGGLGSFFPSGDDISIR